MKPTRYDLPKLDVFILGVLIYVICTGRLPFHEGRAPVNDEMMIYSNKVHKLYTKGKFPDLDGVLFKDLIEGCCSERRFKDASEVVAALKAVTHEDVQG